MLQTSEPAEGEKGRQPCSPSRANESANAPRIKREGFDLLGPHGPAVKLRGFLLPEFFQ
jgi:hypothetical protein